MNKFFKLYNIIFYLISIFCGFFSGAYLVKIFNLAAEQGLAAGAIVVGYGLIVGFIFLVLSIVAVYYFPKKIIMLILKIEIALILIFILITIINLLNKG